MKWVVKSSSVIVGSASGDDVFESVEDCPAPLQQKIRETLDGPNTRTILITNQDAFYRIIQSIHALPPEMRQTAIEMESAREPTQLPPWYAIAGGLLAMATALFGLFLWAAHST